MRLNVNKVRRLERNANYEYIVKYRTLTSQQHRDSRLRNYLTLPRFMTLAIDACTTSREKRERGEERKKKKKRSRQVCSCVSQTLERPTFESDWDMHVLLFFLVASTYVN